MGIVMRMEKTTRSNQMMTISRILRGISVPMINEKEGPLLIKGQRCKKGCKRGRLPFNSEHKSLGQYIAPRLTHQGERLFRHSITIFKAGPKTPPAGEWIRNDSPLNMFLGLLLSLSKRPSKLRANGPYCRLQENGTARPHPPPKPGNPNRISGWIFPVSRPHLGKADCRFAANVLSGSRFLSFKSGLVPCLTVFSLRSFLPFAFRKFGSDGSNCEESLASGTSRT